MREENFERRELRKENKLCFEQKENTKVLRVRKLSSTVNQ